MPTSGGLTPIAETLARAQAFIAKGQFHDATLLARDLLKHAPGDPRSWHLMSAVHQRSGQLEEAAACLERAVACAPTDASYLVRHGQFLARLGRRREALAVAARVAGMPLETSAAVSDALGTLYSYCDEPKRAFEMFTRAVVAAPDNAAYLYNLATAQRMLGYLAPAEASLNQVIAANPNDYGAYYTRADLRTQTVDDNHIEEMLGVLRRGVPDRAAEVTLCFALAKELEDVADYERSFKYLKRGCDLQRRSMSYDVADDVATLDRIVELHDAAAVADHDSGFDSEECIFVMGLPRSGTTLVESIIGAHSDVYAAGELHTFPFQAVQAVKQLTGSAVSKLEFVARSLAVNPRELGRRYITETRPQTGHTRKFVDKTPLNYLYAGLIRRALPRARIIAVVRDPMDSCYAMYKTLFTGAYPFSYDISDLGRYYRAWNRLMSHWRAVLGDALLVVSYEDLVIDQEAVSRRVIGHCGLEWQGACLTFHERQAPVATASAVQVRRPVYRTSIGKWRHYAVQLAELADQLATLGGSTRQDPLPPAGQEL